MINCRRLRWTGHVAREEVSRSAFKIFTSKTIAKSPLGMPRHRWEDNNKMDIKEIVNTSNWIDSSHDSDYWRALLNVTLNLRVS